MAEVICPKCEAAIPLSIAAAVGNKQKFSYRVYPENENMMQAEAIGGQLIAMDKLMRAIAREDGGKVRTYIERIQTHDDASLEFFLIVLPVVAWDDTKGKFVPKKPNVARDSDGNPKGGDGTAPSQSDDSADPKGIAEPVGPPLEPPHNTRKG